MPLANVNEVESRLNGDSSPLTQEEIQDMRLHLRLLSEGALRRIYAELALQNLASIRRFDTSSAKLSGRLLCLTWVIAILTFAMVVLAVIPLIRPFIK